MSVKDALVVQQHWDPSEDRQQTDSLETIQHLIQKSVTTCMYNPDGKPISWILLHHSGAGQCAYTIPEYRGKLLIKK